MKKLIYLLCASLVWCSCNKNNHIKPQHTGPELDTISADIDGVSTFWHDDSLYFTHTSDYGIWIGGAMTGDADEADILIHSPLPIVTGTYVSGSPNNLNGTALGLYYYPPIDDINGFVPALDTVPRLTITISAITDSTIEGTFNGYLIGASGSTVIYKNFTNGKFHLFTKNDP